MCTVAPFFLPGVAPGPAPVFHARSTMQTYAEAAAPAAMSGYGYACDAADIDIDLDAVVRGIRSVHIPAAGFAAPVPMDSVSSPATPVADLLPAPLSSGYAAAAAIRTSSPKKQQEQDPDETYDADIDATLRAMEQDPAQRPSAHYLWTVQAGAGITVATRADLVTWMYNFAGYHGLAAGGTLHRAVAYVDRFLSARSIGHGQLLLLAAAAVFAAAKYEDRRAALALRAGAIAGFLGCAARDVAAAERALLAALGYRLGGPTAYTFVEHFTRRHDDGEEGAGGEGSATAMLRCLAHHLADVALLDYRCVRFLPSAVAAAAIALAKLAMDPAASWTEEEVEVTGYTLEKLGGCMDAIREMRGLGIQGVSPGCAQMMEDCVISYSLPPR